MKNSYYVFSVTLLLFFLAGCINGTSADKQIVAVEQSDDLGAATSTDGRSRLDAIPSGVAKVLPVDDSEPPILHVDEWDAPVPLPSPVNTAGAEDSPFILPDGNTLYFFFTPDVKVPPEKQLLDGVTGIYVTHKDDGNWSEPERIYLVEAGELALDGCPFVLGNELWFCSARKGNFRPLDLYKAEKYGEKWVNWKNAGEKLNVEYGVGEMHISADGQTLYYHSDRSGGQGGLDIWKISWNGSEWGEPINLVEINTSESEGFPFLSQDNQELWFTRTYQGTPAIYRSRWDGTKWGEPQLILSRFAGEPTLDEYGNLYFVHHYYLDGDMVEADIYVAYRH